MLEREWLDSDSVRCKGVEGSAVEAEGNRGLGVGRCRGIGGRAFGRLRLGALICVEVAEDMVLGGWGGGSSNTRVYPK